MSQDQTGKDRRRLMRFFSEHDECGQGFDLRQPGGPGSGKLLARCRGCGSEISYSAEIKSAAPAPARRELQTPVAGGPTLGEPPRRIPWRTSLVTAAITCLAVASATFAAIRLSDDGSDSPSAPAAAGVQASPGAPESPSPSKQTSGDGGPDQHRVTLADGGPSADLPGDWTQRVDGPAVVL
jgi:hypothetical protein